MSNKVHERLKRLMLELDHAERMILDEGLETYTGKTCDEAIELLTDDAVRELVNRIKKKRKSKLNQEVMVYG